MTFSILVNFHNFYRILQFWNFTIVLTGSPHLTQEEILNYSSVDDFDDEDMVDSRNGHYSANPPMTDDDSDEDSEIDLENPYE